MSTHTPTRLDFVDEHIDPKESLYAALEKLYVAGEAHMTAHPTDGAEWHESNAMFYKALDQARAALAAAKE